MTIRRAALVGGALLAVSLATAGCVLESRAGGYYAPTMVSSGGYAPAPNTYAYQPAFAPGYSYYAGGYYGGTYYRPGYYHHSTPFLSVQAAPPNYVSPPVYAPPAAYATPPAAVATPVAPQYAQPPNAIAQPIGPPRAAVGVGVAVPASPGGGGAAVAVPVRP